MSRSHSDVALMLSASHSGNSVKEGTKTENTAFDTNVPETYSTIENAKKEHAKYHSHQVKNPEESINNDLPGGPPSEYDVIPAERGMNVTTATMSEEGVGSGGGVVKGTMPSPPMPAPRRRFEATNVLYEDNELPPDGINHRGVHATSYNTYPSKSYPEQKGSYVTCRCKKKTLFATFFITLAVLLAVASLALSVLLWFGVYDTSPTSSASTSTTASPAITTCNCTDHKAELEGLRNTLTIARAQLETLKNYTAQNTATRDRLLSEISLVEADLTNITEQLSHQEERERTATITGVVGFDECVSSEPQSCTIPDILDGEIQNPCLTPEHDVHIEGEFLVNAECVIDGDGLNGLGSVATLEIIIVDDHRMMRCRCSVILSQPLSTTTILTDTHYCVLRETRCPLTTNHNATITWQN